MQRCAICTRSAEARLAMELDGNQHLDSREAYRRERRKDMLLQQHGYFVLRFLAEDVGRQLDPHSMRSSADCRTAWAARAAGPESSDSDRAE